MTALIPPVTDLPTLAQTVQAHGLLAKKNLGQHFLLDMNITRKIVKISLTQADSHVIEVGPGPGGLTRALLETGAYVTVIERDDRCLALLEELSDAYPGKLTIRNEDALQTDYMSLAKPGPSTRLVSNLPYNISAELLTLWLTRDQGLWHSMTLMFQKEVADRILAPHGSKTYGRLSVLSQLASNPHRGFDLPAHAFSPPPKVQSTVVHFSPASHPTLDLKKLGTLTQHAFSQRRKMIRSSLKGLFGNHLEEKLTAVNLAPTLRAEQLSPEDFARLATLV